MRGIANTDKITDNHLRLRGIGFDAFVFIDIVTFYFFIIKAGWSATYVCDKRSAKLKYEVKAKCRPFDRFAHVMHMSSVNAYAFGLYAK